MKNFKAIIVDDETWCIETLTLLLQYQPDIQIIGHATSAASALTLIQKHQNELDVLFLDVQMPGGDGFTLLQSIHEPTFKIVFTTAYDDYAIKAIKFSALDYLLKPIDNSALSQAMNRLRSMHLQEERKSIDMLRSQLNQKDKYEKIAISSADDITIIEFNRILYLESDNNYTTFHMEDGQYLVSSKNIGYYEDLLLESHFFRVHNSYLINLKKLRKYIKGGAGYAEMQDGKRIQVSVRRKDEFTKVLSMI